MKLGERGGKRKGRAAGWKGEREKGSGFEACTLFECLSESSWAASSNRGHTEVTTTSL